MMLHPMTEEAVQTIDAAIFSGDAGGPEWVERLTRMCERWLRGLREHEEVLAEQEEDDDD